MSTVTGKEYLPLLQRIAELEAQLALQASGRDQTEKRLIESSGVNQILFDTMTLGVVYQNPDGTIIMMNPAAERILGKTRQDFLGETSVSVEHDTLTEDGKPFPGLEHPSMVALRTGKPCSNVLMQVFNPQQQRYRTIDISAVPLFHPGEESPYQVYTVFEDITEREQAEEDLRESEMRFRQLFESSQDAILLTTTDGSIQAANPAAVSMFGYSEAEFLSQKRATIVDPADQRLEKILEERARKGHAFGELNHIRKDGTIFPTELSTNYFTDRDGVKRSSLFIRDITRRVQAEQALRASETRSRMLFETMFDGVIHFDRSGKIISCNPAASEILGFPAEMLMGASTMTPGWDPISEDGSPILPKDRPGPRALRNGQPVHNIVMGTFNPVRNKIVWIMVSVVPLFLPGEDRPYEVYATFKDITVEKEANFLFTKRLELMEFSPAHSVTELMQKALDDLGTLLFSPVGFFYGVDENETTLNLVAWSSSTTAEFCRMDQQDNHHSIDTVGIRADALRTRQAQIHNDLAGQARKGDFPEGHSLLARMMVIPIFRDNKIVALLGLGNKPSDYIPEDAELASRYADYFWDIIQRKQSEDMMGQANERISQLVERIEDIFWVVDPLTRKSEYVSPAFEAIMGRSIEAVENLPGGYENVVLPEDLHILRAACQAELQGQKTDSLYRIRRPDGAIRWLRDKGSPIMDENGQVVRVVGVTRDITEQVEAERALRESDERFRLLIENLDSEFWLITEHDEGKQIYLSPAVEAIWGYPAEHFKTHEDFLELVAPEDRQKVIDVSTRRMLGEKTAVEFRIKRPDGRLCWVWERSFCLFDQEGRITHSGGVTTDITALKLAQQELEEINRSLEQRVRERTAEVQDLYDHAPIGYHSLDKDGFFVMVNQTELDWLGYTHEEILGVKSFRDLLTPQSQQVFALSFPLFKSRGWIRDLEFEMIRKNGSVMDVLINATAIRDSSGNFLMSRTSMVDISEFKKVQEALRVSEQTFRALFENANDAIFLLTPEGKDLEANPSALAMLGYTKEELLQRTNGDLMPAAELADANKRIESLRRGEQLPLYERTMLTKDGKEVQTEINLSAVRDDDGNLIMIQSVSRDITERKRAEAELQAQRDFARQVMDSLGQGLVVSDLQGRMEYANPFMARLLGRSQEELIGETVSSFALAEDLPLIAENFSRRKKGLTSQYEFRIHTAGGEIRHMLIISTPRWREGQVIGAIASFTDISEEKEIEANLRKSRDQLSQANLALERAARMKDEFLASMSHELRTPLTGILGLSEVLQMGTYGDISDKQRQMIKNIENSGRHLLELINDILDLSKIEAGMLELNIEPCALDEICQASLKLVKGLANQKQLAVNYSATPVAMMVQADARRLKQMLVNLLSNAIKFTPNLGSLGLEVTGVPSEKVVRLTVWDTGIGIQPADLPRLFQPFVQLDSSLARQYSGTGLGLSLVKRMVELHGGSISVESVPGEGSRFTISLPWTPEDEDLQRDAAQERSTTSRRLIRRVLVLDVDLTEAESLARYLRMLGITVKTAEIGPNVFELAAIERPETIFLSLSALEQAGFDVLAGLQSDPRISQVPVLLVCNDALQAQNPPGGIFATLVKPLTIAGLRARLEQTAAHNRELEQARQKVELPPLAVGLTGTGLVLVVDDNQLAREMLMDFLATQGYRTLGAESGKQMLSLAASHHPDLVLLDIQMPEMDGLETLRLLRAHRDARLAGVPVIALTALAMPGDRERCLEAGANEYMSKPVSMVRLLEAINALLK